MHPWKPLLSHLELADGPLELYRIIGTQLRADLVVVSACETGYSVGMLGEITYGYDPVSFPQAFLAAGAGAVLSPLWIVEDEATAKLMGYFYGYLGDLDSPEGGFPLGSYAKALAAAQRRFIQETEGVGSRNHPFYWAGFYLMGNPN
jgi:CHAT domain-containing protein